VDLFTMGDEQLSDLWQDLLDSGSVDDPVDKWIKATTDQQQNQEEEDDAPDVLSPFMDYWRLVVPRLVHI
jgi:hypothetical protein